MGFVEIFVSLVPILREGVRAKATLRKKFIILDKQTIYIDPKSLEKPLRVRQSLTAVNPPAARDSRVS